MSKLRWSNTAVQVAVAVWVVASMSLISLTTAAPAIAGQYTVYTCRFPDGSEAGTGAWRVTEGESPSILWTWESCPEGAYALAMAPTTPHPANNHMRSTFVAPPGTEITAYDIWRNTSLAPEFNYYFRALTRLGTVWLERCIAASCLGNGNWDAHVGPANLIRRSGLGGVTGLEFGLSCGLPDASSEVCPARWPGARFALHRADITLRDDTDPVILSVTGPLVATSPPALAGEVPVSISASDHGGGVYQAIFMVDGTARGSAIIDSNEGACSPPFTLAQPCRSSASGTVSFDTRSVDDGEHELSILVTDATGANAASWGPIPIRTSNGRCRPSPVTEAMRLGARITGRQRGNSARIRYGRKLRITGRLIAATGAGVANAQICVSSRPRLRRAGLHAEGMTRTDAEGRFVFVLPRGPSRQVYLVHRLEDGVAADRINVAVRAPIRVRASETRLQNGQTLTLSGGLLAGPFPKRGVVIELQADRGPYWQTFATTRTDRRGRYRLNYTFSRTTGIQRYKLRARVPAQAGYPFAAGAARPVTVQVSG